MWGIRSSIAASLLCLMLEGALASSCGASQGGKAGSTPTPQKNVSAPTATPTVTASPTPASGTGVGGEGTVNAELKVIAEGAYGKVSETFVAVVRDAETYAALREEAGELPTLDADFFRTHAVVAVFLGERRTGGYGVQITRAGEGVLRVSQTSPPKDAMTTQALTAPFKIVSMETSEQTTVRLDLDASLKKAARSFRLREGEFTSSGGFAGRIEKFRLGGDVGVAHLGKLVTLAFDLKAAGTPKARTLQTYATGTTASGGSFTLPRLEAGTLADWPNGGLRANGQFAPDSNTFSLTFEPLASHYADGYEGRGHLEAFATTPSDHNRPPKSGDNPM